MSSEESGANTFLFHCEDCSFCFESTYQAGQKVICPYPSCRHEQVLREPERGIPDVFRLKFLNVRCWPYGTHLMVAELKNFRIGEVAKTYFSNIARLATHFGMTTWVAQIATLLERAKMRAVFEVCHTDDRAEFTTEQVEAMAVAMARLYRESIDRFNAAGGKEKIKHSQKTLIQIMTSHNLVAEGLEATLISIITGAWTAFEGAAGDLWETALNLHPQILSALNGKPNRIGKEPEQREANEAIKEGRKVDWSYVDRLTSGTFNLDGKMGTLLKDKFKFSLLKGIKQAYSAAFGQSLCEQTEYERGRCLRCHAVHCVPQGFTGG
ncbi:MAG: hypothetical protein ACJ8C4_06430 [Gemmataceae bacterium]